MAIAIWFGQRTLRTLREVILLATVAIFCYLNPVWACPGHFVRTEAVLTPPSMASVQQPCPKHRVYGTPDVLSRVLRRLRNLATPEGRQAVSAIEGLQQDLRVCERGCYPGTRLYCGGFL